MIAHHPDKIYYLKSTQAIVWTKPVYTIYELLQQRIRWAAKTSRYKYGFSKFVALIVFSMNAVLLSLLILCILGKLKWSYLFLLYGIKFIIDGVILYKTASFFEQKQVLKSYFISSIIYPFFTMFVALASLSTGYRWKDRSYKQ